MNIRKVLSNWLFRSEIEQFRRVAEDMVADWRMVPYTAMRQQGLLDMLGEIDPRLMDMLAHNVRDYELVSTPGADEHYRVSLVKQARAMFLTDPVISYAVRLWTDFAFGDRPNLTAKDETAQEIWDEFFDADRNAPVTSERKLHYLSETQLNDGELFLAVFASTVDGAATLRAVPTEQIREIVRDPEDASVVLYYRRDWQSAGEAQTLYYRDWAATPKQLARARLPEGAVLADRAGGLEGGTAVVILHAAFMEVGGRGWPLATTGLDWERAYSGFLKDRAAVAKAASAVVEKIKTKGGQRGIDAMRRQVSSSIPGSPDSYERNMPPAAGSIWFENDAVSREWLNRPTNSADAEKDGIGLVTQVGLSLGLYPHYLGRGDYYRLATATAMELPMLRSFNRYQKFWSSVWRDLFKIVVSFKVEFGGQVIDDMGVTVSSDRIIDLAGEDIQRAQESLMDALDRGAIDEETGARIAQSLVRLNLENMGMQGVDEMFVANAEAWARSQRPFEERRAAGGIEGYRAALKIPVYGLWSGKLTRAEFSLIFKESVDAGIQEAWLAGMAKAGMTPDEFTAEDEDGLAKFVLEEFSHVSGLADFIEAGSKANGGKLGALQYRVNLWVNGYNRASARAFALAQADPKCVWKRGATEQGCEDCVYADGRVYRKSVWIKWGWEPQSHALSCSGYNCECSLNPVAKGTRANRGHPRRPVGAR